MSIYNKITLNGTTLIDLSTDTVAVAGDITSGKVGHLNTGTSATGTAQILDTSDATATSSDILSPKTAYVNGSKITGSITSKAAHTYTPTTTNQTISSGQYLSGTQTIAGDANLVSANIASGVSIFGVAGSHTGSANIQSLSVTENGTYTAPSGVDGYSPVVVNVSGGSGGSASDAVRFLDYDGTILYSYSAEDFANLNAMPANPTHTGLTAQGWNWTLTNAKTYVATYGKLDIGQMYITDDGKTRIYISLADSVRLSPYLGICPNGTVVVDWGDNSTTDTLIGTSLTTVQRVQHTYASTGDYVITLEVTSGTFAIYGASTSTNGSYLLTRTDGNITSQRCYQNAIQKVELGLNVSLGDYAFYNCYSLASITIPNGTACIGTYMFSYCYALASITIPNGTTLINAYAFSYCYSLVSIALPSGITNIVTYAFNYCQSLASITLPSGTTYIGAYAFNYCTALASITIPSSATNIGDYVFSHCYSLTSITLPSNTTNISAGEFHYCYSLASITLPSGITSIGAYAFYYCYSLTSITIPSNVTSIGEYAFSYCTSLTNILIPSSVTSIGNYAFQHCHSLSSITIPSSVTNISPGVFDYCTTLASITLPSNITSVSNNMLCNCQSLASITIPSRVTSIGTNGFVGCHSLSSITIPSGVTSIGSWTFANCYGVAEYHFLPTTPPTLTNINAFNNILSDCKIYVPSASLSTYKSASNWSTYASYMVGE